MLLAAGAALWAALQPNPVQQAWLGTKLLLLIVYISLGTMALRRARTPASRLACGPWPHWVASASSPRWRRPGSRSGSGRGRDRRRQGIGPRLGILTATEPRQGHHAGQRDRGLARGRRHGARVRLHPGPRLHGRRGLRHRDAWAA
ncbi:MAG: SirB2 family protein [Rubrivivax sp.]|nr:SirB2 family protein [Rubrivivax sp.]